ncbi:MAG: hypothetical protein JXA67_07665 [Micromonosporaceae bacterium]|nr:hypothetical protein [Micromonosporaceae bacterium]
MDADHSDADATVGEPDLVWDRTVGGEMSVQRQEALLEAMLRHQIGIDPAELGQMLDLAAVGFVNSAWRNSPVEGWHAGNRPLGDGDMLRINAHTTWRVRQIIRRWRTEMGWDAQSASAVLNDPNAAVTTEWLASRVFRWLVNPRRRLPTGVALADLACDDLDAFTDHVNATLGGFVLTARHHGARFAICRAAAHGGLACPHWWGTPTWPALVRTFADVLDRPDHPHWGPDGSWRTRLPPEPPLVEDRARLRRILTNRPWDLDSESAGWIVNAGIRFLREPIPALPDGLVLPP